MRIYCETYGCTSNVGDTEIMLGLAEREGHIVVEDPEEADVILVNTCAVKGTTYRRMLSRLSDLLRENKRVIVAGCLPLVDLRSLERLGEFSGIMSCKSIEYLPRLLGEISSNKTGKVLFRGTIEKPTMPKKRFSTVSAAVQIAEGCTSNCSYCSVKFARGELTSFRLEGIIKEIRGLVQTGYREILLTAQDTAAYGLDGGFKLSQLLQKIASIEGEFRVRVGMMNPKNVLPILDDLVDAFKHECIYKFLHLPVQSGADEILQAMNRGYTVRDFLEIVEKFRREIADLYLCTDVIAGFPGETAEHFQQTKELLERIKPDKTNISRFSPMPKTGASKLPQLNGRVIAARSRELSALCRRIGWEINKGYVGRKLSGFVIEPGRKGGYILRGENYKQVIVDKATMGEFLEVEITEARPTYLKGSPLVAKGKDLVTPRNNAR
jgi:MiaB-like tRNA modifying enzyme